MADPAVPAGRSGLAGAIAPFLTWWRERRLRLDGMPALSRWLALVSLGVAALSAVVILAVGLGWDPPGGFQISGFGDPVSRFLIPWSVVVMAILAAAITASSVDRAWRFPWLTRAAVALAGAALAAQTVSYGWIAEGLGTHSTGGARIAAWIALGTAAVLALLPSRPAERFRGAVSALAALPFVLVLVVWLTSRTGATVALPDLPLTSPRDVLAQGVITLVGSLAAAVGILTLWSLVLSTHQARDLGEGIAVLGRRLPMLLPAVLGIKLLWIGLAYPGVIRWGESAVATSRGDGMVAWLFGAGFGTAAGWWLLRRRSEAPRDEETRLVLRGVGLGFSVVFVGAVLLGLAASSFSVWPGTAPIEFLSGGIDWLLSPDPPVPLWVVVATVGLTLAAAMLLARHRRGISGAALVLGVWMLPRAIELVFLILEREPPFDAPSVPTMDVVMTGLVAVLAVMWWLGRQDRVPPGTLLLILAVSTLVAHPFRILPAGWRTGWLFYLLFAYPLVYGFLFDSAGLNRADPAQRTGKVLRAAAFAALLLATNSMLVVLGQVAPGSESFEQGLLRALGEHYLLVPVAALAVADLIRRQDGPAGRDPAERTRRWFWTTAGRKAADRRPPGDVSPAGS